MTASKARTELARIQVAALVGGGEHTEDIQGVRVTYSTRGNYWIVGASDPTHSHGMAVSQLCLATA